MFLFDVLQTYMRHEHGRYIKRSILQLPSHFTCVDVTAPFGHESDASLRGGCRVVGKPIDIWSLINHLKVPDDSVALYDIKHVT